MTDREKAIVMAYTGVTMLSGEKFQIFHEYIEKILGRPVWTHELAIELVWNEIKEKSKDDFIEICKTERPQGKWITWEEAENDIASPNRHECSCCHDSAQVLVNGIELLSDFCPNCGADMRGGTK